EVNLNVAPDSLPEGAFYLRSDELDVFERKEGIRNAQEMHAKGRVLVQGKDFWGRADSVYYNEASDQIILDGGADGMATMYKMTGGKGGRGQELKGKKIIYVRSTGEFTVERGTGINSLNP